MTDSRRCECGAPEPCFAPRFGGEHVPPEVWSRYEQRKEGEQMSGEREFTGTMEFPDRRCRPTLTVSIGNDIDYFSIRIDDRVVILDQAETYRFRDWLTNQLPNTRRTSR